MKILNNKSALLMATAIIIFLVFFILAGRHSKAVAQGSTQPTPTVTPRPLGIGILGNALRTASLGGPGGGGEVDAEVISETCEEQIIIGNDVDNLWAINQSTVLINEEASNLWYWLGYGHPYANFSVAYCGGSLNLNEVFVILSTPNAEKIILHPDDQYRFNHIFQPFHSTGEYLLEIRNGNYEAIQQAIEVVYAHDGYDGIRFSVVDPDTGKQTAWVQQGKNLRLDYKSPHIEQEIEVSFYPPLGYFSEDGEYFFPDLSNYDYGTESPLFGGEFGGLFDSYDLSSSDIWSVKTNQRQAYSETVAFRKDMPVGVYSLMAGEPYLADGNVDHLEPTDARGNLINALVYTDTPNYRTVTIGTDYLYQVAVLNQEPKEFKLGEYIPLTYGEAYGAKYATFILDVDETTIIETNLRFASVILSSHGSRIARYQHESNDGLTTYFLYGPERYLVITPELSDDVSKSVELRQIEIDAFAYQLFYQGKQAFRTGDLDTAIEKWRRAAQLKPAFTRVHNLLCWARALGGREWGYEEVDALDDCYKAVTQGTVTNDDRLPLYYDSRGVVYVQMGLLEQAADDFERYLKQYPNDTIRQEWVTELRAGRNPFLNEDGTLNEDLLQELQKEPI